MATVVAPSTAVVVVTPPRPKPPRRVKDEAESERRIVVYQKQRAVYEEVMLIFGLIYTLEFALKMIALGCVGYFGDPWCQFDFFLVCTFLVDEFASELLATLMPMPPMVRGQPGCEREPSPSSSVQNPTPTFTPISLS